jgi:hypothetical protein
VLAARREAMSRRLLVETLRVIDGQEREFAMKNKKGHAFVEGMADLFIKPIESLM